MLGLKNFFKNNGLFLLLFAVMVGFYYDGAIDKGPLNTHIWRQTDCISITEHYKNGAPFLEPEMHIQLGDVNTSGKTAGEFPILYYGVGKLWQVFGESFLIYRIVWLSILFFGVFAFYLSVKRLLKHPLWALLLTGLLMCSPTFIVYGVSFLTDIPAICFVFIGLYFFLRYHQEEKHGFFWWAMVFFALAGLIKISSLIAVIFLGFILLIETLGVKTLPNKTVFKRTWKEWLGFMLVLGVIFVWYLYANAYNNQHRFKYTFNDIYPIWEPEKGGLSVLWERVRTSSSYIFLSRSMWWILIVCLLTVVSIKKRIPLFAWLATVIVTLGCFMFVVFWGPLLAVHDYYFGVLIILLPAILIPFVYFTQQQFPKSFKSIWLLSFVSLLFLFNFLYCMDLTRIKFNTKKTDFDVVGNEKLVGDLNWINWDVEYNLYRFYNIRPYLIKIGVKASDKVIVFPDGSFNATLVLLGQKGWTNFENYTKTDEIRELIQKDAKYILLGNDELKNEAFLQPFLTDSIGTFEEHLYIFKLNKKQ